MTTEDKEALGACAVPEQVHRIAEVHRVTKETDVLVHLDLDGDGAADVDTCVPFLDHMLDALGRHGLFGLTVQATGDVQVDDHHTVEDVGIVLGTAVRQALGDAKGIARYGQAVVPMDEALVLCAIDISGRGAAHVDLPIPTQCVGTFDTQLVKEFLIAFAANAGITLHVRLLAGENSHHIIEGAFKALARALMMATRLDPRVTGVPSTKGSL
ncbi:MAG: imidazoleglycerol-phosphate dehydratase HisB [Coriobacteriia bacterium]|nr:imidazoleglycerol-phosphate dehydratase HisB [Coriobacteriia bacterium]MBS5477466.1 imidazoleglycerol-phosphate dehydratase HisB [Coriobacteriia bacterium]